MSIPPSRLGIAAPAWKFVIPLLLATALLGWFFWPGAVVTGVLALYVCYFFRDPRRKSPNIPGVIVSPADGVVASIIELPCPEIEGGRAVRIAIFLNIFNVHIQRAPFAGTVRAIVKKPGKFMNAMNEKCSEENENLTVWLDTELGTMGLRQITGAIARRIVCWAEVGDSLRRGDRYGLIQFGSRVELFLAPGAELKVTPGQKVTGGETVLAVVNSEAVLRPSKESAAEAAGV